MVFINTRFPAGESNRSKNNRLTSKSTEFIINIATRLFSNNFSTLANFIMWFMSLKTTKDYFSDKLVEAEGTKEENTQNSRKILFVGMHFLRKNGDIDKNKERIAETIPLINVDFINIQKGNTDGLEREKRIARAFKDVGGTFLGRLSFSERNILHSVSQKAEHAAVPITRVIDRSKTVASGDFQVSVHDDQWGEMDSDDEIDEDGMPRLLSDMQKKTQPQTMTTGNKGRESSAHLLHTFVIEEESDREFSDSESEGLLPGRVRPRTGAFEPLKEYVEGRLPWTIAKYMAPSS